MQTRERAPQSGTRFLGLDGLRAVAVLVVISHNYGPAPSFAGIRRFTWFRAGYVGVTLFFVLSGFLISQRLIEEYNANRRTDVVAFWGRRARRLLPALAICLALLLANNLRTHISLAESAKAFLSAVLYVFNLVGIHRSPTNPLGGDGWGSLWSLSVEEQFYLLWPFPLVWLWRKHGPRATLGVIGALSVIGAVWTTFLWARSASFNRLYLATDTRSQSLLLGAALAVAWHRFPRVRSEVPKATRFLLPAGIAFLALGFFGSGANPMNPPGWMFGPGVFVTSYLCAFIVWASTVADPRSTAARILGSRPAVEIGKRSYGLYLYHEAVSVYFRNLPGGWVLSLAASAALAAVSYRFVEQPIIHRARQRRTPTSS